VKVLKTALEGVLIIEPDVFGDSRGFFMESYHKKRYSEKAFETEFVQDNISFSHRDSLRGLHYQFPKSQAKLVQVLEGQVYDVAVDIRRGSPTFAQWVGILLSDAPKRQIYIPQGFAHGFCVLSERAYFMYKCSDFYAPDCEGGILWSDPGLNIDWPLKHPLLSQKDRRYPCLEKIAFDRLPLYYGGGR
jgi:dTDP-4-dehydrorhamnose 3,5-epimerase